MKAEELIRCKPFNHIDSLFLLELELRYNNETIPHQKEKKETV